jgi:[protein-PII] uridylyltransferase
MPERYRQSFDGGAMKEHAAIVQRRGDAPVHVELWRRLPSGGAILCVVAEDRPGLLSFISAALTTDRMDVVSAQAYTRTAPGQPAEAVDFLWVRRDGDPPVPVRSVDAARVSEVLLGLLTGKITMESITRAGGKRGDAGGAGVGTAPGGAARVSFGDSTDAGPSVLTIEAMDRPGLLLAITLALFRASVQIVASEASTVRGRVVDRFTLTELNGDAVGRLRRGAVQAAVQAALDAWG